MKRTFFVLACIGMMVAFVGCKRNCRCYRYDGSAVVYSEEELDALGKSCSQMEDSDMGLVNSLCEKIG